MSNLWILLKINFLNAIGINKLKENSRDENIKKAFIGILIFFSVTVFAGLILYLTLGLADMLKQINQMELLLVIGFIGATLFNLINSMYKAPAYLYQARDYEMLSSLPIKDSTIFTSKIILLVLTNYLYSSFIMIIPSIVYFIKVSNSYVYIINLLVMFAVMPLIPIVIASIITYLIGKISCNSKYKNYILIIGSILATLVIILLSYNMENFLDVIIKNSSSIMDISKKVYIPTYFFIDALKNDNLISVFIFLFLSLVIFIGFIIIFAKDFKKINSRMMNIHKKSEYKVKNLKSVTPMKALLKKEIKRYFSSYIYVLNTSFGIVLLLVLSVGIFVLGPEKVSNIINISSHTNLFNVQISLIFMFCIIMSCTTNSSISLEGKNLWILKTLPIKEIDIFKAKINLNILLVLPISIISFILISIKLKFKLDYIFIMVLLMVAVSVFIALYGLLINLIYPKIDYVSENEVVKRSFSSMICTFSGMIYIGIYVFIYYFANIKFELLLMIATVLTTLISLLIWKIINSRGIKLFKNI